MFYNYSIINKKNSKTFLQKFQVLQMQQSKTEKKENTTGKHRHRVRATDEQRSRVLIPAVQPGPSEVAKNVAMFAC